MPYRVKWIGKGDGALSVMTSDLAGVIAKVQELRDHDGREIEVWDNKTGKQVDIDALEASVRQEPSPGP